MHKNLNEFEFLPDPTTDFGVICSCASEKSTYYLVATLAPSFLIGSSFSLVMRTTIKSRKSSKLDQIRPWTAELAALEPLKKIPIDLQWEKSCEHSSAFIFNCIFFILAGNVDMHESLDELEFRQICNRVTALD